ncbi:MAG: cell division protein FtsQ/DivIB, partial [Actinomycetota bacterium]|nr:cell division protein FtsQ/DivIB [Actinomycetota bacterium]
TGRILTASAERPGDLPVIEAAARPGLTATTVGEPLRVAAALPAAIRARVTDVVVVPGAGLELRLRQPRAVVRLGEADQLQAKLAALLTVLEKADLAGITVLDVRVPASPVLTRR